MAGVTRRRRRFGYVRRLPSGRWQASYVGTDGQRHVAEVTFPTRTDAGTWLSLVEARIAHGGWTSSMHERLTIEQWSARWLASVSPHLKRTTVVMYDQLLRLSILPTFGPRP